MTTRPGVHRLLVGAALFLLIQGCAGNGCSCISPIPGGFPPEERVPNAAQVRISESGLAALESDPSGLIGGFLGDGGDLVFDVPPACAQDDNPRICCDGVNMPKAECGPINIDLEAQPGDQPRLEINPAQGASRLDVIVRARVFTAQPLPIRYDTGLLVVNCNATVDTRQSGDQSLRIRVPITLTQDATAGTTRLEPGQIAVENLDNGDISLSGGFSCTLASWFIGFFIDTLTGFVEDALRDMLTEQVCKTCPSGDVSECGPFADACTNNVCMTGDVCLQELGLTGRLAAAGLLGSFSPGTLGAIDLYEVAGGYATTDNGGLALGLLGGALPGGTERDRCGPSAEPPAPMSVPVSSFFQGNTRPDTGAPFDFGLGIHQHNLDLLGWAAYEGGFLCLNVGTRTIDLLTSDTMAILMPSLVELLHGTVSPLVLGLRPQKPPVIALGLNTTTEVNGEQVIDDPLLDITLEELEVDFYAMVDDQYIRVMTMRTDVRLPLNLEVSDDGELIPVLGDLDEALTNIEVFNSEALAETPQQLANKVPALLSVALPLIGDGLGGFALPELGGINITIAPDGITSVDDRQFLAIFGELSVGAQTAAARVDTTASLRAIEVPSHAAFRSDRLDRSLRPRLTFDLGGRHPDGRAVELEWSFRVDGGLWSPYTRSPQVTLSREVFWLQGQHTIEVRAREVGRPETTDPTPVVFRPIIDTVPPRVVITRPSHDSVFVLGTDNVSKGKLTMEYRLADGPWHQASLPAAIELGDYPPEALELRVVDEVGNVTGATGDGAVRPMIGFHGTGSESGCDCSANHAPGAGGLALLLVTLFGLARRTRQRAIERVRRRGGTLLTVVALAIGLGTQPGCSCGGTTGPQCEDQCLEGEVERGPTGRYNSIASDGSRTVVAAYDEGLGDLVLIDVAGGELRYQAVAGVPEDVAPVYEPDTYRGGVVQPGPNVGAWTSVALQGGQARIAYQNIDAGSLELASEDGSSWRIHTIDPGTGGAAGMYASLAYDGGGVPAVAYLAPVVDDGQGGRVAELRFARAGGTAPSSPSDWTIEVVDSAPISCAGLCGAGTVCAVTSGGPELCVAATNDCSDACGGSEVCLDGACLAKVPNPPAHDLPQGTGLFTNLVYLADGRAAIVYYDRTSGDLIMQVGGAGSWTRVELHAGPESDTGMWADAAVDGSGTLHVAYQDALGDQLLYTTFANDAVGPVEIVDDGIRTGDRPHPVGASARVLAGSAGVSIAYQDGATSDLVLATRADGSWSRSDLLSGANLYGFFVHGVVTSTTTYITTYMYDRAYYPPGELVIATIP